MLRTEDVARAAHFDHTLDAWVLSRYDDVLGALREPRLVMPGTTSELDDAHIAVRRAAAGELATDRLRSWRPALADSIGRLIDTLPDNQPVDLVRAIAEPWSLQLACLVTGLGGALPTVEAEECARDALDLARVVFSSAAASTDGSVTSAAHDAASELARLLTEHGAREQHAASVQTFVALTHTLPALLAGAWAALLPDVSQVNALRAQPTLWPTAVGELVRLASPSRALFREATADIHVGEAAMRAGDRVVLLLSAANRDASQFAEPHRLDINRDTGGQLAFGAGAHNCVGAALVRLALEVATRTLLERTANITLHDDHPVGTSSSFAIAGPSHLWVTVHGLNTLAES